MKLKSAKTVQGQEVKIDASKWHLHTTVKINDANVVKADIVTDNGVIPRDRQSPIAKVEEKEALNIPTIFSLFTAHSLLDEGNRFAPMLIVQTRVG